MKLLIIEKGQTVSTVLKSDPMIRIVTLEDLSNILSRHINKESCAGVLIDYSPSVFTGNTGPT